MKSVVKVLVVCLLVCCATFQGALVSGKRATLKDFRSVQPNANSFVAKTPLLIPTTTSSLQASVIQTKPKADLQTTIRSLMPILASAFVVAALMYPLDLVRALQMSNAGAKLTTAELLMNFKNAHGVKGFFTQGLVPELLRSTWSRFIKFALFPIVHQAISGIPESKGTPGTKTIAAILASIPEAISIMPLEIAKIALQLDTKNVYKNDMFAAMAAYYREKGLAGFTVGYSGVQYKQAAWSTGYFATINFFEFYVNKAVNSMANGAFAKKNPKAAKMFAVIFAGFLAGVFGAVLNTPGDTIRSAIQKRVLSNIGKAVPIVGSTTFFGVGQEIIQSKGISGLYAGFKFKACHLGGGGALMAFLVPFFKTVFVPPLPPVPVTVVASAEAVHVVEDVKKML